MTNDEINQENLRKLEQRMALLPREITPPAHAWDAIKAQIEADRSGAPTQAAAAFWQRPAFLAAAGLVLVAGTSLVTLSVTDRGAASAPAGTEAVTASSVAHPVTLSEFAVMEKEYIGTVQRLTETLDRSDSQFTPETVAKLKESLRVIDGAITEARRALEKDPSNSTLIQMLATTYSHKVDLLRRTTEMGRS